MNLLNPPTDNIFSSNADVLVNTVNCVGVMGANLALQFKNLYPKMYEDYKKACNRNLVYPGKIWWYFTGDIWIANFPTKNHWRNPSKLEWIEQGLDDLLVGIEERPLVKSIAIPALGCNLGGLSYSLVKPLIISKLQSLNNIDVILYPPK